MKKNRKNPEDTSYWEPMADSLIGLLFCILLILLLLILYIIQYHDNDKIDDEYGDNEYAYTDYDDGNGLTEPTTTYDDDDYDRVEHDDDGGGGYGGGDGDGDGTDDYPDPDPGKEGDGLDKAAVWVQVVDGETNRTIKAEGIQFELYTYDHILEILNTYYPNKIEYKKYQTTDSGVFYLPEKINLSQYYFKNLTTVVGYDKADNAEFTIEESHDWPEPYVVTIPLYPSKNIIRVQLKDADTKENLTGSTFDVIAAEDIRTKDDTLRYEKGAVVDTIKLDQSGYGESIELYLGSYTLSQHDIPRYYARTDDIDVKVADKSHGKAPVTEVLDPKTRVSVTVSDALYDTTKLEGAVFVLTNDEGDVVGTYQSDEKGRFTVTDFPKNTVYHMVQQSSEEEYLPDPLEYDISVDKYGYIEDQPAVSMQIENVLTRVSFGVCDYLLRGQISDVNMAVLAPDDEVLKVWNSTGLEQMIEGLDEGEYLLVMRGKRENGRKIIVEAIPDVQIHTYYLWTATDTMIVIVLGIVLILFVFFLIKYLIRRRKLRNAKKKGEVTA